MSAPDANPAAAMAAPLLVTLYVAGDNAYSRQARANLESIIVDAGVETTVRIVDVLMNPQLTLEKRIFVTPALVISKGTGPESLVIGDLAERDKVERLLRSACRG